MTAKPPVKPPSRVKRDIKPVINSTNDYTDELDKRVKELESHVNKITTTKYNSNVRSKLIPLTHSDMEAMTKVLETVANQVNKVQKFLNNIIEHA